MSIKTSKSGIWVVLATLSTMGSTALFLPQPSLAQSAPKPQPLQDLFPTKDNNDPFSSRGNGLGVFDLIHRATLSPGRSLEDFSSEQDKNLTDAATEFRERQRQLIQQQQQNQPSVGTTPSDTTPLAPQPVNAK